MNNLKVLHVDDDSGFIDLSQLYLEKENEKLEIETATSAEKALEMLENNRFDIVVSDYQMPVMDGLEFLGTIREEKNSDIPFILVTGKGREEVAMKALNLGADRYMQKGGDPKTQFGVLAQAIEQEAEHWITKKRAKSIEKKYRNLTERAPIGIFLVEGGVFRYVNPKFCSIFECDRDEMAGSDYLEFFVSEDRDSVKNTVAETIEGEEPSHHHFKGLKSSGESIKLEVILIPNIYHENPAVQGIIIESSFLGENEHLEHVFKKADLEIPA